jgi:hypothetical protein
MKLLTKITLLLIATALNYTLHAQCTPDANFPGNQGILPDSLPEATVGVSYSIVIQYKAPVDTQILGVTYIVDSLRPLDPIGMPEGFTAECARPACLVTGGQVGCILLTGTPTKAGVYPIKVPIVTSGKIMLGSIPVPTPSRTDTNTKYQITVHPNTGIKELQAGAGGLLIYPNPAQGKITVSTGNAGVIRIYEITGRLMDSKITAAGEKEQEFNTQAWPKGIYLLEYETAGKIKRGRLAIK